jgi:hypothetical protein
MAAIIGSSASGEICKIIRMSIRNEAVGLVEIVVFFLRILLVFINLGFNVNKLIAMSAAFSSMALFTNKILVS